ncbi:[Acyl-carrier-protein] S-malonyltransferase [Candidatus Koribacter versatilis Ellin345]|uniref:Malonyl CoA-acyl carrier protein transacylase n=1 Tax=Koribacter versatilis (strain Ellin345) TaxID=204669 RepID=Q1IHS7_KORVE|nr:ACP S-malonyltransferase [Candidatus Koribacter versatilis]ABF43573.1 [Acyl-carrier-protein] S-malonyltransferase [Candidatus Koribacter versatilis Ellin345]
MTHQHGPIAFLFPGQGSQSVGMGKELAALYPVAQETFDEADAALGYRLSQLCWEGPEDQLKMTEITQPAILTASVAVWRVLQSKGINPQYVAGHSLGEYSAHVAAGTLDFKDAVRTVRNRGKYMQEAVPVGVGAMAAVLMLPADEVKKVCEEAAQGEVCQAANLNSPNQTVISGSKAAVERAAELAKKRGAKRAVMLPVSAPFHCALMQPAQDRLATDLATLAFHNPEVPVLCNVDVALITTADAARDTLTRQVTGAVQWDASMRKLIELGVKTFVEVGPGTVLSGLMKQIEKTQTCFNVENEDSLQKAMNGLLSNAGQQG